MDEAWKREDENEMYVQGEQCVKEEKEKKGKESLKMHSYWETFDTKVRQGKRKTMR